MRRPRSARLPGTETRGARPRTPRSRWSHCSSRLSSSRQAARYDRAGRASFSGSRTEGSAAPRARGGPPDAVPMGGRQAVHVRGASDVLDPRARRAQRAVGRPAGLCDEPGGRRGRPRGGDRSADRRGRRALADRADERHGPPDPAAGRLRVPLPAGDAGQGRHQRSAGARSQLQRRRGSAVHQRHPGRHPPDARTRMSTVEESDQVVQRRANLEELTKLGVDPYPRRFAGTTAIETIVAEHGAKTGEELEAAQLKTRTAGRIISIRSFGKANFIVLSDGKVRIQAYLRADALSEREFKIFKLLDFGDWVGVEGRLFRTKTNEFTIWASSLEFLAKCLLPLPEKWHGLTDVEIRYRQRYLDLVVNPDSRRVFEVRSRVVTAIREFLITRGFLEVETPMMQPIAGGALARPFVTHHNALDMRLYMRIAPELYLKRLTVGGVERVFEINRNFRNEGISTQHNPEFTMLEFYWAYADYNDLMALTEEMFREVARKATGSEAFTFGEHAISLTPAFRRLSLRAAAREAASRRLGSEVTDADLRSRDRAAALAERLHIAVRPDMGAGRIAAEIFESLCEDDLVQPTFVYDFPTEVDRKSTRLN